MAADGCIRGLRDKPLHVLLFYWRKRISFTLQYYNAWIINQAYLKLNNCGGGNIHRDLELDNIFKFIVLQILYVIVI